MSKSIGPSFSAELDAAGISDRLFSWGSDGVIQFHPDMPQVAKDAVLAVYAAHDPAKLAPPSKRDKALADLAAATTVADLKSALLRLF